MVLITFRNKTTFIDNMTLSDVILPIMDMKKDFTNNKLKFFENLFDDIYFEFNNSKSDNAKYHIFLADNLADFTFNGITINLNKLEELQQSADFYNIIDNFNLIETVSSLDELVEKVSDNPFSI